MSSAVSMTHRDDARLWAVALGLSLLLNVGLLLVAGWWMIESKAFRKDPVVEKPPVPEETVVVIPAELLVPEPEVAVPAGAMPFVRTSEDQRSEPPEVADFIGERDTQATSDRPPDATAPPLPSQAGEKPRYEGELETTVSDYQDGVLDESRPMTAEAVAEPSPPTPEVPSVPEAASTVGEEVETPGQAEELVKNSPQERLMEGPLPYEVPVPKDPDEAEEELKPRPPEQPRQGNSEEMPPREKVDDAPKPAAARPEDPAFRGNQRKTAIRGSISRQGRSALSVDETPEGRYHATIARAVELEWQRNCARHRDFITPGYLTVRFFVDSTGKVRNVQFVGEMETGEVQKGFTLNSIRDADIPAMPAEVRKELDGESLQVIFNFYF